MEFLIKEIINRIKDMEKQGKENEHARDTLKLVNQSEITNPIRKKKCC